MSLQEERIELPDGDFVDLHFRASDNKKPVVLILHGLEGSIDSPYAKGMLKAIENQGWQGVFMHFRGCSGEPNRLQCSYHSGETNDLAFVVKLLRQRNPNLPIAAMGFSLGGNVLLKWLGETGADNPLSAAIAISVPFELKKTSERIQKGFSKFYQWHFLKSLRKRLTYKFRQQPAEVQLPAFSSLRTLAEFDDKITAPLNGFANGEEYYSLSSSRQYLHAVRIPTLIVQAQDDPFVSQDAIPKAHELSAYVDLEVTAGGGHVGFVTGKFPWAAEYWLERRIPQFLQSYL
jgi:predicted alpha/beta-fold hydrolase